MGQLSPWPHCQHRAELHLGGCALPKSCQAPFPWLSYSRSCTDGLVHTPKKRRHWGLWQGDATPQNGREAMGSLHLVEWVNAAGGKGASASPQHGWKLAMTAGEEGFIPPWHQLQAGPQDRCPVEQVFEDFCKLCISVNSTPANDEMQDSCHHVTRAHIATLIY